ncbi:MAG: hypothetical protein ACREOD_03660 [Candidatus Dormibacteria bacterium]
MTNKSVRALLSYLPIHLAVVAFTWRDLGRRPPEQVRGSQGLWRLASALNTLGALAYWLVGRRSAH